MICPFEHSGCFNAIFITNHLILAKIHLLWNLIFKLRLSLPILLVFLMLLQ